MNDKINQNPDFWPRESSGSQEQNQLQQRAELQQNLKNQLQELKNLQEQIQQASDAEKFDHNITEQLSSLEDKIQRLDELQHQAFDLQAEEIQQKLEVLKTSLNALAGLKNEIRTSSPDLYNRIKTHLPDHEQNANRARYQSANQIPNIAPEDWGNPLANLMARAIQRLNA